MKYDSGLKFYAAGSTTRSITMTGGGGTLHGAWSSDVAVSASDRRLKRDIVPIESAASFSTL